MPRLENSQLELFCQERAKAGATDASAYTAAGYRAKNAVNAAACASRILGDAKVAARIAEIKATALPASVMTLDEVLQQISQIARSNIFNVLEWGGTGVQVHKDEISGERRIVNVPKNGIRLINGSELDPASFALIREISLKPNGSFTLKLCSKLPALLALGKHLGLFDNRSPNKMLKETSDGHTQDLAERFAAAERRVKRLADRSSH